MDTHAARAYARSQRWVEPSHLLAMSARMRAPFNLTDQEVQRILKENVGLKKSLDIAHEDLETKDSEVKRLIELIAQTCPFFDTEALEEKLKEKGRLLGEKERKIVALHDKIAFMRARAKMSGVDLELEEDEEVLFAPIPSAHEANSRETLLGRARKNSARKSAVRKLTKSKSSSSLSASAKANPDRQATILSKAPRQQPALQQMRSNSEACYNSGEDGYGRGKFWRLRNVSLRSSKPQFQRVPSSASPSPS